MTANLLLVNSRLVISGDDYVRRAALSISGATPRKDGTVSLAYNLLTLDATLGAFPHAELSYQLENQMEDDHLISLLGAKVNDRSLVVWDQPGLWEWQAQALARLRLGSTCLFDDRGMGKTRVVVEAIRESQREGRRPAVVLTPKRLRETWRVAVGLWWGPSRVVVPTAATWSEAIGQVGQAEITVLTYDSILNDEIRTAVEILDPEWLVLDEAHNLKKRQSRNPRANGEMSRFSKSGAARSLPGRRRVALSGSPMPNRWDEVWTLLNFVAPERFTSYWQFVEMLGDVNVSFWGGKEISKDIRRKDLWDKIFDRWIVMRYRPDHGKVWDFVPVELSPEEQAAYRAMLTEWEVSKPDGQKLDAPTKLAQLTRLQQLAGGLGTWETHDENGRQVSTYHLAHPSSKTDALLDMLAGLQRAVVFTRFRDRANFVASAIAKTVTEAVVFSGATSEKDAHYNLGRFADTAGHPYPMAAVCVFGTISEGVNELTTASDIFFLDWTTAKDVSQAADRLDRPGQTRLVRCVTLYAEGTVDEAALDREAGKVRPLRELLRAPEAWEWLLDR